MFGRILILLGLAAAAGLSAGAAEAGPTRINSCGTISTPGAYVLNRNLNGFGAAGDCIEIDASHVTLDLNGFAIGGPLLVGGVPGGHGVHVLCCDNQNVAIRNGTVTGWVSGIVADPAVSGIVVENVRALDNDGVGINVRDNALLTGNHASGNLNFGILFGAGGVVTRNVVNDNTGSGIQGECESVVTHNTAFGNGGTNLSITNSAANPDCVVENNATGP